MKRKDGFKGERSIVLPQAVVSLVEDDPLVSSVFITDIGYYPRAEYHYRRRDNVISEYVFIYCVDGRGWYSVNGRRYDVGKDSYFILPPGTPHEYAAEENDPWSIYWIHFRGSLASIYAAGCTVPQEVTPAMASRIHARINLFEEIFRTLDASYAIESIRYAMATFQHYLASLRYIQQYRGAEDGTANRDIISLTIHFFEENIERHLTLKAVSDFVGLSPSRLSAVFRDRTGYSPLSYFTLLKMKEACDLLDNTSMKINQISLKLGFEDPYYFSRQFAKVMGMSPKSYRFRSRT